MKVIDIVTKLISQGHKITYRVRTDGGIIVTSVNGKKVGITEGNKMVRAMIGEGGALSEKRAIQTSYNVKKFIKLKEDEKRLKTSISEDLEKKLRKIQRMSRKRKNAEEVRVNKKKLRWYVKEYGEQRAMDYLEGRERYLQGYAHYENIEFLISRVERLKMETNDKDLIKDIDKLIEEIRSKKETFKEEWILPIHEILGTSPSVSTGYRNLPINERIKKVREIIK